jgi:hypothetical protein
MIEMRAMSTTIIQLLTSGLILGLIGALLNAEGPSAIALVGVALGSFWFLQLWLPELRREALSSASFTLFVLLLALWVWESRPGHSGGSSSCSPWPPGSSNGSPSAGTACA